MSFGFDPSIILGGRPADTEGMARTFADMSRLGIQQRQADATLAEMTRQQGQERRLSDILQQNANNPEAIGPALMRGGFGKESLDWIGRQADVGYKAAQTQGAQTEALRKRGEYMARPLRNGIPKNQEELTQLRESWKSMGFSDGDMTGTEIFDPQQTPQLLQQIRALGLSEEDVQRESNNAAQRAEDERHHRAIETQFGLTTNPTTGSTFRIDKRTGAVSPVESGGPPLAGNGPLKPKDVEDQFKDLAASVSTVKGRANLNAQNQARLYNSERVKQIALDDNGKIKDLSPALITDLAAATAALSSNGAPAQSIIEHFLPKGRGMSQAAVSEWLTNDPHGAGQMGFVKQMVDLANREEKLIGHQMRAGQLQGVPNFAHLKKLNPARYNSILKGAGLDPAEIDDNGLPTGGSHPQDDDAKALDWATKHANDPRAQAILRLHGIATK